MQAIVRQLGGSVAIVIPKALATENELTPGTPVDLSQGEDGIVVRRSRRRARRPIQDIVNEIDPAAYAAHKSLATDRAVGREIW